MDFVDTIYYWILIVVMGIFFLLMVIRESQLFKSMKVMDSLIKKNKKRERRYQKNADIHSYLAEAAADRAEDYRKEKEIMKKKAIKTLLCGGGAFAAVVFLGACRWKKQAVNEDYRYVLNYNQTVNLDSGSKKVQKQERESEGESEEIRKSLHLEWYDEIIGEESTDITRENMNKYRWAVRDIYLEEPYITDEERKPEDESEFKRRLEIFRNAVQRPIENRKSEELWEEFHAGWYIFQTNVKSDIAFQTFVLAEGAHCNAKRDSGTKMDTLVYLAGVKKAGESFIKFTKMDPGNGDTIPVKAMSFRIGKRDYEEGLRKKSEQNPEAIHFLLMAYEEFHFSIDGEDMKSEEYLPELYYCSLSCLHIMSYMDDIGLRKELCVLELEKWEEYKDYVGENFSSMRIEGQEKDLQGIIDKLERYCQ